MAGDSFSLTLFGQYLIGMAGAPILGFLAVIIEEWFPEVERFTVKAISFCSLLIGCIFGYILPGSIVEEDLGKISTVMLTEAIFATISLFLGALSIRDKPHIAISCSTVLFKPPKFSNFQQEMKFLINVPKVFATIPIFGLGLGLTYAVPVVIDIILESTHIPFKHKGLMGFVYVLSGFLTRIFGVVWMKGKGKPNYDFVLKVTSSCSALCLFLLTLFLHSLEVTNLAFLYILHVFLGIGLVGSVTFACNSISQSTFPVQELISITLVLMCTAFFGIVQTHVSIVTFFDGAELLALAGASLVYWAYIMFIHNTDYRKYEAKQQTLQLHNDFERFYIDDVEECKQEDRKGFPPVSPIQEKRSFQFFSYNQLSMYSKDLISSTPHSPLLKPQDEREERKFNRSQSSDTFNRKKTKDESARLYELVEMNDLMSH